MTPEEALDKSMELLVSEEFQPIVVKALTNAKDLAAGAATLVYPIIFRMMQETDIPDEELTGSEDGDGIAIYLLAEVFDIAAEAGLVDGAEGDEPSEEARALAQRAVELLGDLLAQANGAMAQNAQSGPQSDPMAQPQQPPPQQAPQQRSLLGAA